MRSCVTFYGSTVMEAARALDVPLSVHQLERYRRREEAQSGHSSRRREPPLDMKWKGRLRGLYSQARDYWLGVGALDRAAECVDKCARPFTADELRMIINRYRDDHRPYHLEQAKCARDLLFQMTCRQAGVKIVKKTAGAGAV